MKVIVKNNKTRMELLNIKAKYNYSSKEISIKTGIFYHKVLSLLNGKKIPTLQDLIKIGNAFNLKIDNILDYEIVEE